MNLKLCLIYKDNWQYMVALPRSVRAHFQLEFKPCFQ